MYRVPFISARCVAFQDNLNVVIYVNVLAINVLSEVIYQMFYEVRGAVKGYVLCRLCLCSSHYQGWELLDMSPPPTPVCFFSSVLIYMIVDYQDFSVGIFDL